MFSTTQSALSGLMKVEVEGKKVKPFKIGYLI